MKDNNIRRIENLPVWDGKARVNRTVIRATTENAKEFYCEPVAQRRFQPLPPSISAALDNMSPEERDKFLEMVRAEVATKFNNN